LIPLPQGVKYCPVGAASIRWRNMLILWGILPFVGIKLIDLVLVALHLA
jgi:K+-transporting ATPase ATPase B chain